MNSLKNKLTIVTDLLDQRDAYMEKHPDIEYEDEFPSPLFIYNVMMHLPTVDLREIATKRKTMSIDDMVLHFEKQNPQIVETAVFIPHDDTQT